MTLFLSCYIWPLGEEHSSVESELETVVDLQVFIVVTVESSIYRRERSSIEASDTPDAQWRGVDITDSGAFSSMSLWKIVTLNLTKERKKKIFIKEIFFFIIMSGFHLECILNYMTCYRFSNQKLIQFQMLFII